MTMPVASGLGALPRLQDIAAATDVLASLFPQSSVRVEGARLVRLKPGKRAVVLWRAVIDGEPRLYYAKLFATARARRVDSNHRAIRDALAGSESVVVPQPAGHTLGGSLFVMRALPGRPAAKQLAGGDQALARRVARALAAVHGASAALERRHTMDDELAILDTRTAELGCRRPGLASQAAALAAAVRERLTGRPWRFSSLHRDFYADQILDLGANRPSVGIIDFDDAKLGEPAVDVANFAAHLVLDAMHEPGAGAEGARAPELGALVARRAFLNEYVRLDPDLDLPSVDALEAATLVRLAAIHGPRGGAELEARLVEAGWRALHRVPPVRSAALLHIADEPWTPVR